MKPFTSIIFAALLMLQTTVNIKAQEIWGMTSQGGTDDLGVIYKTDADGNNYSVQFSFVDDDKPSSPVGGVVLYGNNNLWGLTRYGGTYNKGTRYEYNISQGTLHKREDFNGDPKGAYPKGNLTRVFSDLYYGTTQKGGANDQGTIFKIDGGLQTVVYNFNASNSAEYCYPMGTMLYDNNTANLYGIYMENYIYPNYGLFQYNISSNTLTHLTGSSVYDEKYDGSTPSLQFNDDHSVLYYSIRRNIHKYNLSSGTEEKIYSINSEYIYGNIYKIIYSGDNLYYFVDYNFYKLDLSDNSSHYICSAANNGVKAANGKIYLFHRSEVKEYDPTNGEITVVHTFHNITFASEKFFSGGIAEKDGILYGTTTNTGKYDRGTIFSFDTNTYEYNTLCSFIGSTGNTPGGKLTKGQDGKLYGLMKAGNHKGTGGIFSFNPHTKDFRVMHFFGYDANSYPDDGENPYGSLEHFLKDDDDIFLGTTSSGGTNNFGTIFKIKGYYKKIFDFDGSNGKAPYGTPIYASDGNIYGLTTLGGSHGDGVLYKLEPDEDFYNFTYSVVHNFGDITYDGSTPASGLTEHSGKLWGVTHNGGSQSKGIIFSYDLATGSYSKRVNFVGSNGANPIGNLIYFNGQLYGVTRAGGDNDKGTLYQYNFQSGTAIVKHSFNDTGDGYEPVGTLTVSNGKLYGMCSKGGAYGKGTMFEYDPATGNVIDKRDFTGANGSTPTYNNSLLTTCTAQEIIPDVSTLPVITAQCEVNELDTAKAKTNCGDVVIGKSDATFPITGQGTHTVTWTYEDELGNSATQQQTVIIDDTTDPVPDVTYLPDIYAECSFQDPKRNRPEATDNCTGSITADTDTEFPISDEGTTVITWLYDDGNGNVATQNQNVIIGIDNSVTVDGNTITANVTGSYTYQWYQRSGIWTILLQGETGRSFTPDQSGTYYVEIDNGTCSTTSDDVTITVTGIKNMAESGISVFPNPVKDVVNIRNSKNIDLKISLINTTGETIKVINSISDNIQINMSGLPAGIYFININNGEASFIQKIIKQ